MNECVVLALYVLFSLSVTAMLAFHFYRQGKIDGAKWASGRIIEILKEASAKSQKTEENEKGN